MPVYTYHCENCEREFDKRQSFAEEALKKCPSCTKEALRKVYKPAQVVFKGSGYYVTDNRKAKTKAGAGSAKSNGTKPDSEGSSSESKSEGKSNGAKETVSKTKEKTASSTSKENK
ncbi:MAG: zinc ribbon domain-containing protein [Chloroflexota bacterium]